MIAALWLLGNVTVVAFVTYHLASVSTAVRFTYSLRLSFGFSTKPLLLFLSHSFFIGQGMFNIAKAFLKFFFRRTEP